jgi:23S rRNA (cytidine1920-2'-O)/16S rRNA (cytidine1409-2'-O)-methyltransferase
MRLLKPGGQIIPLIKPQFEAGPERVGKGGVVRDPNVHRAVLLKILTWAADHGLTLLGLIRSPLRGPAGNVEFLAHLTTDPFAIPLSLADAIASCVPETPDR